MEKEVAGLPAYSANDSNERQLALFVGGASHRAQRLNRDRDVCEFGQQLRGVITVSVREMWIRSIHKGVLKPAPFAWPQHCISCTTTQPWCATPRMYLGLWKSAEPPLGAVFRSNMDYVMDDKCHCVFIKSVNAILCLN